MTGVGCGVVGNAKSTTKLVTGMGERAPSS
jgi:hypothetical protein